MEIESERVSKICVMLSADDLLAYTTRSGDVVQLNVKTNETSVIIDNAALVNIVVEYCHLKRHSARRHHG